MQKEMSPTARLLIVDDEAAQVTALCRTLRAEGYATTGFTAPSEALSALRDGDFDIVITDLMMPEMDGIALLRASREIDADLLIDRFGADLPAEGRRLLDKISMKARDMGQLIDDLLRFSQVSRQPLVKQPVDVTRLATEVLVELRAQEPERNVAVVLGQLPAASADAALLKQVFVNLEANALKFTRHCAQPVIEIDGWQEKDQCLYCIRDNGAGFDMRYADKLFGIWQRLHRADDFEGTGIGLSIVQRVVERHGGRIWAEAEVGKGAKFTFSLPL